MLTQTEMTNILAGWTCPICGKPADATAVFTSTDDQGRMIFVHKACDPVTKEIAGHVFELKVGWYIASRPIAQVGVTEYPVSIKDKDENVVWVVNGLSYDEANELINSFNNGRISFEGREWRK